MVRHRESELADIDKAEVSVVSGCLKQIDVLGARQLVPDQVSRIANDYDWLDLYDQGWSHCPGELNFIAGAVAINIDAHESILGATSIIIRTRGVHPVV